MQWNVYLSGEIHTKWRDEIIKKCEILELPIEFLSPVTNHELSDDVGIEILGKEDKKDKEKIYNALETISSEKASDADKTYGERIKGYKLPYPIIEEIKYGSSYNYVQ